MERDDEGPQVKVCKPISYISDFGMFQVQLVFLLLMLHHTEVQSYWGLPLLEAVRKENTRLESATNLSRFLIRKILPGRLLILVRTGVSLRATNMVIIPNHSPMKRKDVMN